LIPFKQPADPSLSFLKLAMQLKFPRKYLFAFPQAFFELIEMKLMEHQIAFCLKHIDEHDGNKTMQLQELPMKYRIWRYLNMKRDLSSLLLLERYSI
jgi:hypothetical protein